MKSYIRPDFNSIFLNLTDECNLRCRYCFVAKHPHYMTLKVALDTVDLMNAINTEKYPEGGHPGAIQFFGGEPTLMWDSIIVPVINYCKEKDILNKRLTFGITTNGILLDNEKMDFLQENNIGLLFSIDGKKETQDFNRPCANENLSSFDILEPKIAEIAKRFHTTFRGTLLPETCDKLYENIAFASQFEFANCFFIPDFSNNNWTPDKLKILEEQVRKYSLYFIESYRQGKEPFDMSSYTRAFDQLKKLEDTTINNKILGHNEQFCGLGLNTASVGYDGSIYGCQEIASLGKFENPYYLGDIYRGIDVNKRNALYNMFMNTPCSSENKDHCKKCLFMPICQTATCHANCFMRTGNIGKKSAIECFWDELTLKEAIFVTNVLTANNNEMFMEKYGFLNKELSK